MALRFVDSFDHYDDNTEFTRKGYSSADSNIKPIAAAGRNGTYGLQSSSGGLVRVTFAKTIDAQATWTAGFAAKHTGGTFVAGGIAIEFLDVGDEQVGAYLNVDGTFSIRRGGMAGTVLETTSESISLNTWYFFEFQATISDAGAYAFRANGVEWAADATADTQDTANATANVIQLSLVAASTVTIDDLYVEDGTGGVHDDFLGDCRVECLFATGAGATTAWTPSAGANWDCVKDITPNDDTDYVSSSTATNVDTYAYGNLATTSGSVFGVQTVIYARKDDAGARTIDHVIRIGGGDQEAGLTQSLTDTYLYHLHVWETDPSDAGAWTIADVNGAEFGIKLEA